jgi:hypothetical protein
MVFPVKELRPGVQSLTEQTGIRNKKKKKKKQKKQKKKKKKMKKKKRRQ